MRGGLVAHALEAAKVLALARFSVVNTMVTSARVRVVASYLAELIKRERVILEGREL